MSALLPSVLYPVAAVRALDAAAIASGIPGLELMQRAGREAWAMLVRRWPAARRLCVVCGPGNNGGDGYVVAAEALRLGRELVLIEVGDPAQSGPDAQACRALALAAGAQATGVLNGIAGADVVVDALFGIGLSRPPAGDFLAAIEAMNASRLPVFSLDIPSGLNGDTGHAPGAVVQATATLSFIALKQGLCTGRAADCVGALAYADLGVPADIFVGVPPGAVRLSAPQLPPRRRTAHKGDAGHVLVIGGAAGYAGAARLAAEAALRTGAGLVSAAVAPESLTVVSAGRPEIMARAVTGARDLGPLLAKASVIAIGPGLGQSDWSRELLAAVRETRLPLVVDADALNLLALDPEYRDDWCLTPHPGEAARLLGWSHAAAVNADRYAALAALQSRYGGAVVLKGAGSLVGDAEGVGVVTAGNPGMASGGMGDVLTGVIAALRAQGLGAGEAARRGAMLHAMAADRAAALGGERGLLASDLFPALRQLANQA